MNLNNIDISKLPADVRRKFKQLQVMHAEKKIQNKAKDDFLSFVKCMWPDFIEGSHHRHIAKKFNQLASGEINRLIVNMPPRHTKSEFASFLLPAWMVGRDPKLKIIQATHTGELAVRFGRKAKNLIDSEDYTKIFKTRLQEDSKAAGRWETAQGGEYFAAGVGGAITGRGADLLIIDDPHSEQDAMSPTALESAYEWYTSGPRQRLQPGGKIILVMTRWSNKDLTGKLLQNQKEAKADQWHVVEFPAILDQGSSKAKPVWPEYWKLDELEKVQATLPTGKWNAQWMQNPTAEEGAILKREWWRTYTKENIPQLDHVIQSYDTAFLKKETADYSAITTWGVFFPDEDSGANLILLDAIKGRYEFPELRRLALDQYKYWMPETVIIEAKASGLPLTYELRQMDIPVVNFSPNKGNDKHARVNAVAPLFESGMIWAPEQKFADDVIEECAAFPYGDHDDLVDSTTQAIMRFRQGGLIGHPEDYIDEKVDQRKKELLLMNPIVKWVLQTMMKGQTGVVRTLPNKKLLDINVNMTVERLIKNGIDPSAIKTPGQVDNIIKQIEQPKVIPADSPRGRGITEALFGKKGEVFDMEGKKIKSGSKIMGGKEVKDSNVDAIIADIKSLEPITAMKEANNIIARKGKYKNLTKAESKKILQETEDHIFERDVPFDPQEDFAIGGRVGLKSGMTRRAFMKLMGGVGAGIGALKTGLLGLGGKQATKEVAKEIITTPATAGKPAWFDALVTRVVNEGEDVTKKFATKDREIVHATKVDDDAMVTVYRDLDDGTVRVDIDDATTNVMGEQGDSVVSLEVRGGQLEEGVKGKTPTEFEAVENDYRNYTTSPDGDYDTEVVENVVNNTKDLTADLTKVKMYAKGQKKPTIKEMMIQRDRAKRLDQAAKDPADYASDRGPDIDTKDYDYASGGLAGMLGE